MVSIDNDYGYIEVFIKYLQALINVIISAFERLTGATKKDETTAAPADGE